jgi:hypothetical protein
MEQGNRGARRRERRDGGERSSRRVRAGWGRTMLAAEVAACSASEARLTVDCGQWLSKSRKAGHDGAAAGLRLSLTGKLEVEVALLALDGCGGGSGLQDGDTPTPADVLDGDQLALPKLTDDVHGCASRRHADHEGEIFVRRARQACARGAGECGQHDEVAGIEVRFGWHQAASSCALAVVCSFMKPRTFASVSGQRRRPARSCLTKCRSPSARCPNAVGEI